MVPLLFYLHIYMRVCGFVSRDQKKLLKWDYKAISYAVKLSCVILNVFWDTDPYYSYNTEYLREMGNADFAVPELMQEYEPGKQNNYKDHESVALVSPIAAFSLYAQLKIHWSTLRGIIYSALCLSEWFYVHLPPSREYVRKLKKSLGKNQSFLI